MSRFIISKRLPAEWKKAGLSWAVVEPAQAGTAEWYLCATRSQIMADTIAKALNEKHKPAYYECGICGAWHSALWNGDCREDAARFNPEDLDAKHGSNGWECVEMPT